MDKINLSAPNLQLINAKLFINGIHITRFNGISFMLGNRKHEITRGSDGASTGYGITFETMTGSLMSHAELVAELCQSSSTGRVSGLNPARMQLIFEKGLILMEYEFEGVLFDDVQASFERDTASSTSDISFSYSDIIINGKRDN